MQTSVFISKELLELGMSGIFRLLVGLTDFNSTYQSEKTINVADHFLKISVEASHGGGPISDQAGGFFWAPTLDHKACLLGLSVSHPIHCHLKLHFLPQRTSSSAETKQIGHEILK